MLFNIPYIGTMTARTDWVAGGNFDGYIQADVITFFEEGCVVIWEHRVVAASFDDVLPKDHLMHKATYDFNDPRGIKFLGYRGRFLGDKKQFLVLDPMSSNTGGPLCFVAAV
ncbi:MAG TPA: hypothetical protein VK177_21595 [Flavobacteriales bacterium]|nr:hypothetical protein [Flavobacteriales bacterium]